MFKFKTAACSLLKKKKEKWEYDWGVVDKTTLVGDKHTSTIITKCAWNKK